MGKIIGYILLKIFGWSYEGEVPKEKKYVVISVPHTSMDDFVWGKFAFASKGVKPVVFIRKESFKFPLGNILRWLGAKPVNRGNGALGLMEQVIANFNENKTFVVCITPEGTRDPVKKLKKGFYFIAQKARVPIYLGTVCYRKKICTIGERFDPTGNIEKDMQYIKEYYEKINSLPKHPDRYNPNFS